ncbi:MAG: universal stress protein [Deltaproteobacteria bacterium]|nr:universal stress protein [Deltaproteobacteria bacterium]
MRSSSSPPVRHILWSVSPRTEIDVLLRSISALGAFARAHEAVIQPVFVHNLNEGGIDEAEREFGKAIGRFSEPLFIRPKVISCAGSSVNGAVDALCDYAALSASDVIGVSTHARAGLSRMVLGSFAETLILRSKVPVLVVNPHDLWREERVGRILVASDLDAESFGFFKRVASVASRMESSLLIYSKTDKAQHLARAKVAGLWAQEVAQAFGVAAEIMIETGSEEVSSAIIRHASVSKCGMIALQTRSGALKAALHGSIARALARSAPCPLWIERA